jgi:glycerophosphoryl diester phosphodiesterase
MSGRVLNIAHRGASSRFPENTLAAFAGAIDAGADMCELDVQLSRDGALVVIHDDTVDRTTGGHGAVAAMTVEQLKRLDAGVSFGSEFRGERIPTLDEVFTCVGGRCALNIELKSAGLEQKVCAAIRDHDALATAIVSSFDWDALDRIRQFHPAVRVGLLASRWPVRLLGAATAIKAHAIHPRADIVTEDLCTAAHERILDVYTWTVDDVDTMRKLIAYGVDGIMTNYPERLRMLMER